MATDFYKKSKHVEYLESCTLTWFAERYEQLSVSAHRIPTASVCYPILGENGHSVRSIEGECLFNCLIFFDIQEQS